MKRLLEGAPIEFAVPNSGLTNPGTSFTNQYVTRTKCEAVKLIWFDV